MKGAVVGANLPQDFKEQVEALTVAEVNERSIREILQEGKCVQEIEALVHSCEEAQHVLSVQPCTEKEMIKQVAVVYEPFHAALTSCVEKGFGKGLAYDIFEEPGEPEAIDELYCASPAAFQLLVISSVKSVQRAAKAAL
ncbi:hypothetical protein COCOBI_05-0380 [Coccomyxa sp. Obi]|nr:hypothetical protein COCOBI_05-0380 [Coccomyxa sp. Obi]